MKKTDGNKTTIKSVNPEYMTIKSPSGHWICVTPDMFEDIQRKSKPKKVKTKSKSK